MERMEGGEEEEIGMVLARASHLKSMLLTTTTTTTVAPQKQEEQQQQQNEEEKAEEDSEEEEESGEGGSSSSSSSSSESAARRSISDAFDSLEHRLSSLQALQQQQRYERESSLFQIDRSRKILLARLREYKGNNLEVIHEALKFAGGTLDHDDDDDLLLPPYPSHLPDLFVMNDHPYHHASPVIPKCKLAQYEATLQEAKKKENGPEEQKRRSHGNKPQGVKHAFWLIAKSAMTFVGVVSILSLAGFKPTPRRDGIQFNKIQELFFFHRRRSGEERQAPVGCPPGKVLVMEEGQPRCLVKERVEIPFELDVTAPKINYGFG